jgi:uncharacterized protein (TIGR02145 family)
MMFYISPCLVSKYFMKKIISKQVNLHALLILLITVAGCRKEEQAATTVTDKDGNTYDLVTIGSQVWIGQNLKTTKYNDGSPITVITDNSGTAWSSLTTGACCWYGNDESVIGATYGALYNWHAVNSGKLCPSGWHVPTKDDWTRLSFALEGSLVAGGKLKEADTIHWAGAPPDLPPYPVASNESGFTALPGGSCSGPVFSGLRNYGVWWSSTTDNTDTAWGFTLYSNSETTNENSYSLNFGFSVRCLRDGTN